jgi:hypothetical protein
MCCAAEASVQVKPSALFSDHTVPQSGMPVPIRGTADPAEKITIKFNRQTRSATADASGKWMLRLTTLKPGGPFEMTIAGSKAGETPIVRAHSRATPRHQGHEILLQPACTRDPRERSQPDGQLLLDIIRHSNPA